MIFNMVGGGGGSGATLVVSSPVNVSVTVSKDDKSYTKNSGSLGSTTFKGLATGTWTVTISGNGQTATRTIEITADYAITIAFFSATINITYPATSTCVVADSGGQTVASDTNTTSSTKTWTATVNATGTYTVTATATDGSGKSKSQSVSITADGQSESVTLSYALDIFANGILAYPMEGLKNLSADTATVIIDGSEMVWTAVDSNNNGRTFNFTTTDKIDVTEYNTLNIEYIVETAAGMIEGRNFFGVSANKKASMGSADYGAATTFTTTPTGNYILSVPIDSITGQHYISAFALLANGATLKVRVSRLYLE